MSAAKYSFLIAFLVLIFGFGIMCVLYYLWKDDNPSSNLPGLFYYKAAALGDPICLPLIIGALVYHRCNQDTKKGFFGKASIILGAIAFIAGVLIQAEWLINDNTGLNWSLPEPHRFNLGGWYHAVFFVVIITGIILLFTEYVWYSHIHPTIITDFVLYFAVVFFCLLHFIDDYINKEKPITSITYAAIISIIICCILKTIQNHRLETQKIVSYVPIIASGITAYVISLTQI